MKGGSYMGLQCWDKASGWNRQQCQWLVLIASKSEVTFAWHTHLERDFVLCACGTRGCVVLVLLIVAAFALRSFLHTFLLKMGGCCGTGTSPVAVNFRLLPISGLRGAHAVIPLA